MSLEQDELSRLMWMYLLHNTGGLYAHWALRCITQRAIRSFQKFATIPCILHDRAQCEFARSLLECVIKKWWSVQDHTAHCVWCPRHRAAVRHTHILPDVYLRNFVCAESYGPQMCQTLGCCAMCCGQTPILISGSCTRSWNACNLGSVYTHTYTCFILAEIQLELTFRCLLMLVCTACIVYLRIYMHIYIYIYIYIHIYIYIYKFIYSLHILVCTLRVLCTWWMCFGAGAGPRATGGCHSHSVLT